MKAQWRKQFAEKRRSWMNVILAALLSAVFFVGPAWGQPVGPVTNGMSDPLRLQGETYSVYLGTSALTERGICFDTTAAACNSNGGFTYNKNSALWSIYGGTAIVATARYQTTSRFSSTVASGNNGFECTNAGCRVDLGPGANDYFHSPAGDPIITPASFTVGGNFSTNSGVNGATSAGWSTTASYTHGAGGLRLLLSSTAPTIGSAGTSPSVLANSGANSFRIDVGTGGTATGFTMTFPASTNRWICQCQNATDNSTVRRIVQTGYSTTTCVMEQRTVSTNAAVAFGAGDDVDCIAFPH